MRVSFLFMGNGDGRCHRIGNPLMILVLCSADYRSRLIVSVAPGWAPHFSLLVQSKVSKRNTPQHPGHATRDFPHSGTVPRVVSKGHPWPIVPHLASMPNAPLHGTCAQPSDGDWLSAEPPSIQMSRSFLRGSMEPSENCRDARTDSPVRRVSGVGVEGVERHGCRERRKGPGTALVRRPLEQRWSERTRNVAQRSDGPYAGCVSSWLLLLAAQQEEVTRRARRNL